MGLANRFSNLERAAFLDRGVRPLRRLVHRVLPRGPVRDALHGVWLGHPAHPMLVQLPIGAWMSSGVLDALPGYERAARRLIQAGLLAAPPALAAGWADWSEQHKHQARVGLVHAVSNGAAIGLYVASLATRARGRCATGKLLAYAGLTAVGVGGYLGGHIAYRQAGGVNHAEEPRHSLPSQWRALVPFAELPERRLSRHELDGVPLAVVRDGTAVHALVDACSHLAGPLSEGSLSGASHDGCVQCPWHGSTFRLADGEVVHGPATAPQPSLETRVHSGMVEVRARG